MEQLHGLLVVNKPRGLSSAQCTNRLKRLGQRKIGHAGTLDPMAQGVLLVLLGQATKLSGHLMAGGEKRYVAVVELGRATDTWDDEGVNVLVTDPEMLRARFADPALEAALRTEVIGWTGESVQTVPPYSAAKHEGKPLYSLARAGQETPEKRKTVHISHAEVLWVDLPRAAFRVVCSSGTYIRSLAHSLGTRLGCGAVLTELTREYSHPFGLAQAHPLDAVLAQPDSLPERIVSVADALSHWPQVVVDDTRVQDIRNGVACPADAAVTAGDKALLMTTDGAALALAEAAVKQGRVVWTILRGLWP